MKVVSNLVSSDGAKYPRAPLRRWITATINLSWESLLGGLGKQLPQPPDIINLLIPCTCSCTHSFPHILSACHGPGKMWGEKNI